MQVNVVMSKEEKRWALVILIIALLLIYYVNKLYIFILNVEFENYKPINISIKTGFIFSKTTIITFGEKETETKVKFYGYLIKTIPLKNQEGKNTGEYELEIYKNKNSKKPYKKISIHTDDYYVKTVTTPLGKV